MQLEFKQEEFEFLKYYLFCQSTKSFAYDKLIISSIKSTEDIGFYLFTDEVHFVTVLKDKNKRKIDFNYVFNIQQFTKLVLSPFPSTDISIQGDSILIGSKSKYQLQKFDINLLSDSIIKQIDLKQFPSLFELKDIDKYKGVKIFSGEKELSILNFYNSYFVTSDRYNYSVALKSNNVFSDCYFPMIIMNLLSTFRIEKTECLVSEDKYCIKIKDTILIFDKITESIIPNILKDEYKDMYYHKYKIIIKRKLLEEALQRLSIILMPDKGFKILVTLLESGIKIESKEENEYAEEIIECRIDSDVVGVQFIVSAKNLLMVLSSLDIDDIEIRVHNKDMSTILIKEIESDNKLYIVNLYEK